MTENEFLAEQFEEHRGRTCGPSPTACSARSARPTTRSRRRGCGSAAPTRARSRTCGGWLTTVVARVCLNMLRSRRSRREEPLDDVHVPEPIVSRADGLDPEHEALLADSVGLALLVVLETLDPAERLAFVLHDMFAVPFDEIGPIVDRSPAAARQLASRARRRVQGEAPVPDADLAEQRRVVDAFFAAARDGDFEALVAVLDPDVVLRADGGASGPRPRSRSAAREAVAARP